eukprot:scaffold3278_cov115-Skeletonema_dohrnii-CCMP3373.AAC.6
MLRRDLSRQMAINIFNYNAIKPEHTSTTYNAIKPEQAVVSVLTLLYGSQLSHCGNMRARSNGLWSSLVIGTTHL